MTTETWGDDPFAISTGATSLAFPTEGTVHEGKVVRVDSDVIGRDFTTGLPAKWPSGDDKYSVVVTLETEEGERALWVTKYPKDAKYRAIAEAQQELGRPMQKGDLLKIAYTGNDPDNPQRKLYRVKITAGQIDHFKKDEENPPF